MPVKLTLNRSRQLPAEDTPAFGGIAERFRRAGDLDRAITLCREGLRKFPDLLSARVTLGWALLDKGAYDEARTELEFVMRRAPDNLAAIRGLAELHDRAETTAIETPAAWREETAPSALEAEAPAVVVAAAPAAPVVANIAADTHLAEAASVNPLLVSMAEAACGPAVENEHVVTEPMPGAYLSAEAVSQPAEELDPILPAQGDWALDPPIARAFDCPSGAADAAAELNLDDVVSLPAEGQPGLEELAGEFAARGAGEPVEDAVVELPDLVEAPPLSDVFAAALEEAESADPETAARDLAGEGERSEGLPLVPLRQAAMPDGVAEQVSDTRLERWGTVVIPIGPRSANRHTLTGLEGLLRKVERRRLSTSGSIP